MEAQGQTEPGWQDGSHEPGDAHGHPCQQQLLGEQQVLAQQRCRSKASPFTARCLGQLCWCRGIWTCSGDHSMSQR